MQLTCSSIFLINQWVLRSEDNFPAGSMAKFYFTAENFFRHYEPFLTLDNEFAPWGVSFRSVEGSENIIPGSLDYSMDEDWYSEPILLEGPVLRGWKDSGWYFPRTEFDAGHEFRTHHLFSIHFSDEDRGLSRSSSGKGKGISMAPSGSLKRSRTDEETMQQVTNTFLSSFLRVFILASICSLRKTGPYLQGKSLSVLSLSNDLMDFEYGGNSKVPRPLINSVFPEDS